MKRGRTSEAFKAKGRATLTRTDIVTAATALLDDEGIEALSMRKLATALGTGPSTLYWHVRDKDQLLALILDDTIAHVDAPASGRWNARLITMLDDARKAITPRPMLVPVILGARWDIGQHALRIADTSLALLIEGGVPETELADAYFLLLHYTMGFVEAEAHARFNATYAQEHQGRATSPVDASPIDAYPNLVRYGPATTPADMPTRFNYGLTTILAGITTGRPKRARQTGSRE